MLKNRAGVTNNTESHEHNLEFLDLTNNNIFKIGMKIENSLYFKIVSFS